MHRVVFLSLVAACGGGGSSGDPDAGGTDAAADTAGDPGPTIAAVTPNAGFYPGGQRLTIDGEALAGATAVTIGGAACGDLTAVSATRVQCTAPSGDVGAADVTITAAAGTGTAAGAFTYRAFTTVTTLAGGAAFGSANGTGDVATLSSAVNGLVLDGDTLYIADGTSYRVRAMDLSGLSATAPAAAQVTLSTIAGAGTRGSDDSTDGTGATATFIQPDDVIVAGGSLYVADTDWLTYPSSARLRKITPATGETVTLGTSDGLAQMAWDGGTYIYVARCGSTVDRIDLGSGATMTVWAGAENDLDDATGALADARFDCPYGVALSSDKRTLYVADYANNKVKAIDIAGGTVSVLAGSGANAQTDAASGAAAAFGDVCKLAAAGRYLFVADMNNCAVRSIDTASTAVATVVGSTAACGYADGPLATAQIGYVNTVVYHPAFGLFVAGSDWGWRSLTPTGRLQLIH